VPLGAPPWPTLDPFLFCVHHDDAYPKGNDAMGPAASLAGRDLGMDFAGKDGWRMYHGQVVPGFPSHPHRGFETVTLARRGYIDHSDSLGATARFGEGDAQWMTAGAGIVHSEMFPLVRRDADNPAELFQIWLNLPGRKKMVRPYFTMFWNEQIPRVVEETGGARAVVTLVAGKLGDRRPPACPPDSWAADPANDVTIATLRFDAGARFTLPATPVNRVLYFFAGEGLTVGGAPVPARHALQLRPGEPAELVAAAACELLLLQGQPIGEPVVQHGPFVMSTQAEVQQAFADYRRTQFGGWPWGRNDPVHPRDEGRFARHADGRVERPVPAP
jgi:redox-sensitive bicupin YhaK (pirin superfamily)